jgi:hypothetical protein
LYESIFLITLNLLFFFCCLGRYEALYKTPSMLPAFPESPSAGTKGATCIAPTRIRKTGVVLKAEKDEQKKVGLCRSLLIVERYYVAVTNETELNQGNSV